MKQIDVILEEIYLEGKFDDIKNSILNSIFKSVFGVDIKNVISNINISEIKKIDTSFENIKDPKTKSNRTFEYIQSQFLKNGFIISQGLKDDIYKLEVFDKNGKLNIIPYMKLVYVVFDSIKKQIKNKINQNESYYYKENKSEVTQKTETITDSSGNEVTKTTFFKNGKEIHSSTSLNEKQQNMLTAKISDGLKGGFFQLKGVKKLIGGLALVFLLITVSHVSELASLPTPESVQKAHEVYLMKKGNKKDFSKIVIDTIEGGDDDRTKELTSKQQNYADNEESIKKLNEMKTETQKQLEDDEGSFLGKLGFKDSKIKSYKDSIKLIDNAVEGFFKPAQETLKKQIGDLDSKIKDLRAKKVSYLSDVETLVDDFDSSQQSEQAINDTLQEIVQKNLLESSEVLKEAAKEKEELRSTTINNLDYKIYDDIKKQNSGFDKLDKKQKEDKVVEYLKNHQKQNENVKKTLEGIEKLDEQIKELYNSADKILNKTITPDDLDIAKKIFVSENMKLIENKISNTQETGVSYEINYEVDDSGNVKIEKNDDFNKLQDDYNKYKENKELQSKFNDFLSKLKIDKNELSQTIEKIETFKKEIKKLEKDPEKNKEKINELKNEISKLSNNNKYSSQQLLSDLDGLYNFIDYKDLSLKDAIKVFKLIDLDNSIDEKVDNTKTSDIKIDNKKTEDKKTDKKNDQPIKKQNVEVNGFIKNAMKDLGIDTVDEYNSFMNILNNFTGVWSPSDYQDFIKTLKDNGIKISDLEKVMDEEVKSEINGANLWTKSADGKWEIKKENGENFKKVIDKKIKEKDNKDQKKEDKKKDEKKEDQKKEDKKKKPTSSEIKDKLALDTEKYNFLAKTLKNVYGDEKIDWSLNDLKSFSDFIKYNNIDFSDLFDASLDSVVQQNIKSDIWKSDDGGKTWKIDDTKVEGFKKTINDNSKVKEKKETEKKETEKSDSKKITTTAKDFMEKVGINKDEFKSLKKISGSFTEKNWTVGEYKDFIKSLKDNGIKLSDVEKHINDDIIKNSINNDIWKQKTGKDGKTPIEKNDKPVWEVDSNKVKELKKNIDKKDLNKKLNETYEKQKPVMTKYKSLTDDEKKLIKYNISDYKEKQQKIDNLKAFDKKLTTEQKIEKENALKLQKSSKTYVVNTLEIDDSQFDELLSNFYLESNKKHNNLMTILQENYFK